MTIARFPRLLLALITVVAACGSAPRPAPSAPSPPPPAPAAAARTIVGIDVAQLAASIATLDLGLRDLTWRLGVDLATGTEVDLMISFASPEDAQACAGAVRPLIETARRSPEFQGSVTALQLEVHGAEIHVMARLNAHVTAGLIKGMTERIIELTHGTPGG